jgi:hypothetical protein
MKAIRYALATTVTLLGMLAMGSIAGRFVSSAWWMLAAATSVCLIVPLGIALWLKRLAAEPERVPGAITILLLLNLTLLGILVGLAGSTTQQALRNHGTWWTRLSVSAGEPNEKTSDWKQTAGKVVGWLASAIPTEQSAPRSRSGEESAGERPTAARRSTADPYDNQQGEGPADPATEPNVATDERAAPDEALTESPADASPNGEPAEGVTTVGFRRHGSAIVVPVRLRGPRLAKEVQMLFDTGATFSTIDSRTLADLGLYVTSSDPTIDLRTANGVSRQTITVIEGASLGSASVDGGLTVALCDACGSENVVGLLGLNFARHFRVTVDHADGLLQLERKQTAPSRLYDIRPFVQLSDIRGQQRGNLLRVTLWVGNHSPRPLRELTVTAYAGDSANTSVSGHISSLSPGRRKLQFEGRVPASAEGFRVELSDASW